MSSILTSTRVLNCLVTGQVRAGTTVVQTSLTEHPSAICHADVLHDSTKVRKEVYEDYFGRCTGRNPEWFAPQENDLSPEMFLTTRIFDHPRHNEKVVGVRVLYSQIQGHDLWEYIRERCLEGDFCMIHVIRNPLACYVSMKQAEQTKVWSQDINDRTTLDQPAAVWVDPKEFTKFCRRQLASEQKLRLMCDDRLEIEYRELFINYPAVMRGIFQYLGLAPFPEVRPGIRRLKNCGMRERIGNFEYAQQAVPSDVRPYFKENLF